MSEGVLIASDDNVLSITFNRPERKNALTIPVIAEIIAALEQAAIDSHTRVVVLRGAGGVFCTGSDWVATNSEQGEKPRPGTLQRRIPLQHHRLVELLVDIQLPVVAVVEGWAAGLGAQLALAADFTIATETSQLWEPFIERGFSPDSGATWFLPRLVGLARAREMLLLGRKVSGLEAADWGLIHRAVAEDELDAEVASLVASLAAAPTVAVGLAKSCLNRGMAATLHEAMTAELGAVEITSRTADFREGLAAFTERREPRFEGR